jgi:hypothetical protein
MRISGGARLLLTLLALLLLTPMLALPWTNEARLRTALNRSLTPWPEGKDFRHDPATYLRGVSSWLADRAGPVSEAAKLKSKILYYVLATSPQANYALGRGPFVFLTSGRPDQPYDFFEDACRHPEDPAFLRDVARTLSDLADVEETLGIPIRVVAFPTALTVFAEELPSSVPRADREACLARVRGPSRLEELARTSKGRLIHPLSQLRDARGDPAFFPAGNYHATGLSVRIVREILVDARDVLDERVSRVSGPGELLSFFGIERPFDSYELTPSRPVVVDRAGMATYTTLLARHLPKEETPYPALMVFDNASDRVSGTALFLTDSFGVLSARTFAARYKRLIQVFTNNMHQEEIYDVVERLGTAEPIDEIVLLVQEGGLPRVLTWATALKGNAAQIRQAIRVRGGKEREAQP